MLKFIGSGSAFNTKLGNTSAYYKKGNQMLLIDCGSNIFQRIKENNLLEGIDEVYTLITHSHSDHVGSLSDLILYSYYSHGEFCKRKVHVISPFDNKVEELLTINGCIKNQHYTINNIGGSHDIKIGSMKTKFKFIRNTHVEEIPSYGLILNIEDNNIYYSGDTSKILSVDIDMINENIWYDCVYVDTCKSDYEGNVHLSLRKLTEIIEPKCRHKVWCMHLDEGFDREEAESLGFNVVVNEF